MFISEKIPRDGAQGLGKNYKKISLGCFATKDEAIKARKEAESKYIDWSDVNG